MANTKRTNNTIEWPSTGHFTIADLKALYPSMVEITLRFRVNKALEEGVISTVGKIKPAIGRPRLVFVKGSATVEATALAAKSGVLPMEESKSSVGVADVKSQPATVVTPAAVVSKQTVTTTV